MVGLIRKGDLSQCTYVMKTGVAASGPKDHADADASVDEPAVSKPRRVNPLSPTCM